jgi:hypothetical protein
MFNGVLRRINRVSHVKSDHTESPPYSKQDHEIPHTHVSEDQADSEPKKRVISGRGLVTGAPRAGIHALVRRLGMDVWIDGYDPTQTSDYGKAHRQPDGGLVILEYTACGWPTENRESLSSFEHFIRDLDINLLVYRVDDDERVKWLEDGYTMYIKPKQSPAFRVYVVATCADLLPTDGSGRERINEGQALSEKYGFEFNLVSSRTAEGCHELEASLIAAALNADD